MTQSSIDGLVTSLTTKTSTWSGEEGLGALVKVNGVDPASIDSYAQWQQQNVASNPYVFPNPIPKFSLEQGLYWPQANDCYDFAQRAFTASGSFNHVDGTFFAPGLQNQAGKGAITNFVRGIT